MSRLNRRVLHRPGSFAYFGAKTLDANASAVSSKLDGSEEAIVFRSAARWCRCRPTAPYFIYLDASFHTFFHNTFNPSDFDAGDIQRIFYEEAAFMERASGVFFESQWGLDRAVHAYGLKGAHYQVVGRGGAFSPPEADTWQSGSLRILTVAMDFHIKGGDLVLAAYQELKARFPLLEWNIIGGKPSIEVLPTGVTYHGMLDPDNHRDAERFRKLLASSWLLVHPTREDTSPLVITEAAYFGCPTVSVDAFAIPELVTQGETGILVDAPVTVASLAQAIENLLTDAPGYLRMRRQARAKAIANHSWSSVGSRMCEGIDTVLTTIAPPAT